MDANNLYLMRTTTGCFLGITGVILAVAFFLIMFPVFYFTTGRKYDSILGKKTNIEFLAFSNMQSVVLGRYAYYAMVLANKRRREMKLTHDIFGDFNFLQHATSWDIKISKIFYLIIFIVMACFGLGFICFLPEMLADLKTWFHNTF